VHGSRVNHTCNLGVPSTWSFGVLVTRRQVFWPSGLVWSSVDDLVWWMRRPLLRGKLRSKDGIRVTGARGGEHYLCGNDFTYLARALVARPSSWPEETWWLKTYLVELQRGLEVALVHRYHGKKLTCRVCILPTHSFTFPHFILVTCVLWLS
jgi:hypothetical protein